MKIKWLFIRCMMSSITFTQITKPLINIEQLTLREKIGQLFMVSHYPETPLESIETLINEYHIGGIIFQGMGTSAQQKERTAHFQKISRLPLLIGQDLECGSSKRLTDGAYCGNAASLGARNDTTYTHTTARAIGRLAKDLGVHINFAPVVDVHTNEKNPIINERSFGSDPSLVIAHAQAYASGLHAEGIISCVKHFPGHGDTSVDSHHALPCIDHDIERLEKIELAPFHYFIRNNIPTLMIGHLVVPALGTRNRPASLSRACVTDYVRKQLGFTGLIISDGLDMKAVTDIHQVQGMVELEAFIAGNDILLCPIHVAQAVTLIEQTVLEYPALMEELDQHVSRILHLKEKIFSANKKN